MSHHSTPSQTILNLARAVNQLAKARDRFRVASMTSEKIQCERLARRLLNEMETLTDTPESMSGEAQVVGRFSEQELQEKCFCGHDRRTHLRAGGWCTAKIGGSSTQQTCSCMGFGAAR